MAYLTIMLLPSHLLLYITPSDTNRSRGPVLESERTQLQVPNKISHFQLCEPAKQWGHHTNQCQRKCWNHMTLAPQKLDQLFVQFLSLQRSHFCLTMSKPKWTLHFGIDVICNWFLKCVIWATKENLLQMTKSECEILQWDLVAIFTDLIMSVWSLILQCSFVLCVSACLKSNFGQRNDMWQQQKMHKLWLPTLPTPPPLPVLYVL